MLGESCTSTASWGGEGRRTRSEQGGFLAPKIYIPSPGGWQESGQERNDAELLADGNRQKVAAYDEGRVEAVHTRIGGATAPAAVLPEDATQGQQRHMEDHGINDPVTQSPQKSLQPREQVERKIEEALTLCGRHIL